MYCDRLELMPKYASPTVSRGRSTTIHNHENVRFRLLLRLDERKPIQKYLRFHSGSGLGRQLVPEHVHLSYRSLCLVRLLVQLLAQQLDFVLYAQGRQQDPVAFRRLSHRGAVYLAAVLKLTKSRNRQYRKYCAP